LNNNSKFDIFDIANMTNGLITEINKFAAKSANALIILQCLILSVAYVW